MNRREFVQLVGLASGASLLGSCNLDRKTEKIIPYLVPPDDGVIPGQAVYKPTTCAECPAGCGVSAKVVDYRVGKLEGIGSHPINGGTLCMRGQASISRLYHPGRLTTPMRKNAAGDFEPVTWDAAVAAVAGALPEKKSRSFGFKGAKHSRKSVFLSARTTGTLSDLIDRFCNATGVERLPELETYSHSAIRRANEALFGLPEIPAYRIDKADFLLTIGADIFETFTSPVSHAAQFGRAKKRGRLAWAHVEPHVSLTGVQADFRYAITPGSEPYLLAFLLRKVARANLAGDRHIAGMVEALPNLSSRGFAEKTGLSVEQIEDMARRLLSAEHPLVIAGGVSTMQAQGLEVALLTALLQWAAGMTDSTVDFDHAEDYTHVGSLGDLAALHDRLESGGIGVLFLAGVDPFSGAAAAANVEGPIDKAALRVGLDEFMTPAMKHCDIVLPLSDTLESWGDATPRRGLVTVIQPVVEPARGSRTTGDVLLDILARRSGSAPTTYQEYLLSRWNETYGAAGVEKLLADGFLERPAARRRVVLDREEASRRLRRIRMADAMVKPVLVVAPSVRTFDGRSRDIALLSEIPDPLTTISYGGWVSMSPLTAKGRAIAEQDEVAVSVSGWAVELPVKLQPGLPRDVMVVQCGAPDSWPAAIEPRTGEPVVSFAGASFEKTGRTLAVPIMSGSQSQEGRGVIPRPEHGGEGHHGDETLYAKHEHATYRWGMAIDLGLCIGCSACAAACYVENNVPVVGPELHLQGREMSWLRIEPFYDEKTDEVEFQPMLCQHCGNAPCESVCPVYATYHNEEGLNAQVYNRCVGTRYCANNCPYKVRRFNWFDNKPRTAQNPTRNPEVSIRGAGVMEKCTLCVQRIRVARDKAKDNGVKVGDGEVTTACAQACPTNAIVFGNLKDEESEVAKWARSDRSHRVFESLGTAPAIHYLGSKWKKDHA